MAVILIRRADWEALSDARRQALREMTATPLLGQPAFGTVDGVDYAAFDDPRIDEEQAALVAALMENPGALDG